MTLPRIAFCTTVKNRTPHLKLTLPRNLADNVDYANCVFVIVDYGSQDDLVEYLLALHLTDIVSGRIVLYSTGDVGQFKMSHAKNVAHRCGLMEGADILVNLDADNYTGTGFATYVAEQFATPNIFLWSAMIKHVLPRGISGRIAVTATAFINAGGYDEQFHTWSPDDKDFNHRLQRLGYEGREIDVRFLDGVRHNDKMRFREYPHVANSDSCDELPILDCDSTVVNGGRIGLGPIWRNGHTQPPLSAIPTRIFGVGFHKTGTTSLHTALRTLGFDSAHWKSAHWAKAIWSEMRAFGRSETLERHYALCDLPIAILYRELDIAYPGSKFILTIRDEESWLQSVEAHWSYENNKFRATWNTDPFTHKIHREIYGQKHFDHDIFLARFRRHNAEVVDYFRHRSDDLLVHDGCWESLCAFLGKPVPDVDYPIENLTTKPL